MSLKDAQALATRRHISGGINRILIIIFVIYFRRMIAVLIVISSMVILVALALMGVVFWAVGVVGGGSAPGVQTGRRV